MLDECIDWLERIAQAEEESTRGRFARICGLAATKGKNLLVAVNSLTLDALAQEGGALIRPLIETFEFLTYLRLDPSRVDEVLNDKLPSAGEIAKKIEGPFRDIREYLNTDASHLSFGVHAMRHLVDQEGKFRKQQIHSEEVLARNLTLLSSFMLLLLFESLSCLFASEVDAESLTQRAEQWKVDVKRLFPGPINGGA